MRIAYCSSTAIPRVVIPVDFAGVPAYLPRIRELSKKYGFAIVEDIAHAIGSTYTHDSTTYACGSCAHSDLAIFSFHPVKTVTTAVMTNDDRLAERLRTLRTHGMTKDPAKLTRNDGPWYYEMHEQGNNYRITDMQCALELSQLKKLPQFMARRQEIVTQYNDAFKNRSDLILPPWPDETSPCFHLYVIRFKEGAAPTPDYVRLTRKEKHSPSSALLPRPPAAPLSAHVWLCGRQVPGCRGVLSRMSESSAISRNDG